MRHNAILMSFLAFILVAAGCQDSGNGGEGLSVDDPFIGETSAIKLSFVENSPPAEVIANDLEFDATVTVENIGETDITSGDLTLTISGFYPQNFNIANNELLSKANIINLESVKKDQGNNRIRGGLEQVRFPTDGSSFKYDAELKGDQRFPFRVEACYTYSTEVLAQMCLMEDLTSTDRPVCNPTGSKQIYNSGAPVHVTTFSQSIGGRDKLQLNFNVRKVGSSEVFMLDSDCSDSPSQKNRVNVNVATGIQGLTCLGLTGGQEVEGLTGQYTGTLLLSDGGASFTCIQTLPDASRVDSLKTFSLTLNYQLKDSIQKSVLVKTFQN